MSDANKAVLIRRVALILLNNVLSSKFDTTEANCLCFSRLHIDLMCRPFRFTLLKDRIYVCVKYEISIFCERYQANKQTYIHTIEFWYQLQSFLDVWCRVSESG